MARRNWRWVTRNRNSNVVRIHQSAIMPRWDPDDQRYMCASETVPICAIEFTNTTGIHVKKGQCHKVYFIATATSYTKQAKGTHDKPTNL
jgi:hypothetical protein